MRIQNRKRSQDDCPPFWPTLSCWTRQLHSERLTSKHRPVRGAWLSAAGDPARGPRRNAAPAVHTASRPGALPPLKAGEVTPNHAVSGRRCLPGRLWDRRALRDRGAGAPVAPAHLQVPPAASPGSRLSARRSWGRGPVNARDSNDSFSRASRLPSEPRQGAARSLPVRKTRPDCDSPPSAGCFRSRKNERPGT